MTPPVLSPRIVWTAEWIVAAILIPIGWVLGLYRWLFGSALGALALSLSVYFWLRHHSISRPFLPSELLKWFSDQDYGVRSGIAGGLLTIVGFSIAFWTAAATWRRQKELELRIEASKEIHRRYQQALRAIDSIGAYLHVLVFALEGNNPATPPPQIIYNFVFVNSQSQAVFRDVQTLYTAMLDVHSLSAEYAPIFNNVPSVTEDLRRAKAAIEAAREKIALVSPPQADPNSAKFLAEFIAQCNLATTREALQACRSAKETASLLYGKGTGILLEQIIRPNFYSIWRVTRLGRAVGKTFLRLPE